MNIKNFFQNIFVKIRGGTSGAIIDTEMMMLTAKVCIRRIAFENAANMIANIFSLAEFQTYEKGKAIRKKNYYRLNIEANKNKSATEFWKSVVYDLINNNEALVIQSNGELYKADNFNKKENVLYEASYKDITVSNMRFNKHFSEKEILYFKLNNENIKGVIEAITKDYAELVEYSKQNYKRSNARRGVLNIPTSYPQNPQAQEDLQRLLNENLKSFFKSESGAILPLSNGITYTDLTNQTYKNGSDSRDIRALIDDIFDYTAMAFRIPVQFLKCGTTDSDKAWNNFMSFCLKPIIKNVENEINRKMYGEDLYSKGNYLVIDTSKIKDVDIKEVSSAIDVLTRNGVNTLDDNLRLLGKEPLGGELGGKRFITLNLKEIEK